MQLRPAGGKIGETQMSKGTLIVDLQSIMWSRVHGECLRGGDRQDERERVVMKVPSAMRGQRMRRLARRVNRC